MSKDAEFEQLYVRHYRRVHGLCRQLLGSHGQAEDAAQEVFMRAYRSFGRYDPAQPFEGWILAIAGNYCIDLLRRRTKEASLFSDEDVEQLDAPSESPSPLGLLLSQERVGEVGEALAALPEKYRIPLVLAYYQEAGYDEIAAALGITRNHVGVLILRAKQALRRRLAETGHDASRNSRLARGADRALQGDPS